MMYRIYDVVHVESWKNQYDCGWKGQEENFAVSTLGTSALGDPHPL